MGGLIPDSISQKSFDISRPYLQDDLTWCVQKSKNHPLILNVFWVATPECYILIIFGVGYPIGLIYYIMIQFDMKYRNRNQRDWHYSMIVIALPAITGMNQRFQPQHMVLRFFYAFILFMSFVYWQIFFFFLIRFMQPVSQWQISTVAEMVENGFRLSGSYEVLSLITFDERVH